MYSIVNIIKTLLLLINISILKLPQWNLLKHFFLPFFCTSANVNIFLKLESVTVKFNKHQSRYKHYFWFLFKESIVSQNTLYNKLNYHYSTKHIYFCSNLWDRYTVSKCLLKSPRHIFISVLMLNKTWKV